MPQYVILADHTPQTCPGASKRVGDFARETLSMKLPELSGKLGVRMQTMLHLDPGHKTLMIVEAPTIEAVTELAFESGFTQFNDVQVYPTSSLEELAQRSANWEPLYE